MSPEALKHLKLDKLMFVTDPDYNLIGSMTAKEFAQNAYIKFHNGLHLSILTGYAAGGSPKPHDHYEVHIIKHGNGWEDNPWYPEGPTSHLTEEEVVDLIGKMDNHIVQITA